MAIQMNLLPKVKADYIQASRNKKLVSFICFLVTGTTLGILIILFVAVNVIQSKYSRDLSKDIKTQSDQLKAIPDLDKILTVQNQLTNLKGLHDQKPVTSRLFGYIQSITPDKVSITDLTVDFNAMTISIKGTADSLSTVNKYVDTMKFTTYKTADGQTGKAFNNVVEAEFHKTDKETSYTINASYANVIFASGQDVKLEVPPGKITTRSETEKPVDLFKEAPKETP
jgi:Tfp pilus assembly protein PilN